MYNDCETLVLTRAGYTEYCQVRVGMHQASALRQLLIMDVLHADRYRKGATMGDVVCG